MREIVNRVTLPQAPAGRRQKLLNAAASLILEKGAANLTLDAVCAAAHVSKGGLLYYFDSKLALLEALVDDLAAQLEADIERQTAKSEGTSQALAYLRAVARMGELPRNQQLCKALTFICAAQPELTVRVQRNIRHLSPAQPADAPVALEELRVRLVADGLWLADIYGSYRITSQQRAELLKSLDPDFVSQDEHHEPG